MSSTKPRLVAPAEIEPLLEHMSRQLLDDAELPKPTSPRGRGDSDFDVQRARETRLERWARTTAEPGWMRSWAIWQGGEVVGHAELHAMELPAAVHRGTLGLAVEARMRRRGFAAALMGALIDWARGDDAVAWIDLGVFEHNAAARELYRKLGFQEVGRLTDRFRVNGMAVTDIQMTLRVDG